MKTLEFIKEMRDRMLREGIPVVPQTGDGPFFIEKDFAMIRDYIVDEQYQWICKAFGLIESEQLRKMFRDVTCGGGKEWKEINQLNSSALLSFLCFHAVGIGGRTIKIDGTAYNKVEFEFKSPLRGSSSPSWMDVVLLNENDKKALFLESKFTEYIKQTVRPLTISSYYNQRYEEVFGITNIDLGDDNRTHFEGNSWKADRPVYLEGVKQMICHFLGIIDQVKNGIAPVENDNNKYKDDCWSEIKDYEEIVLGEIVYDFKDGVATSYGNTYRALSSLLNKYCKSCGVEKKFAVRKDLLTYQKVFEANAGLLTDNVGKFYGLKS